MNEMKKGVAVLVYIGKVDAQKISEDASELKSLCSSAGIDVVCEISQIRDEIDAKYYIGRGKVQEIAEKTKVHGADIVVFNNSLSGSKINNLMNDIGVQVIDRCMLILDIFASRAKSQEGKLQVELAQLKYSMPRLNMYAGAVNKYGGGVGMRGPGETKLETNRRVIEQNIHKKEIELRELKKRRDLNRQNRQKNGKRTVAIVGYTNSGKSTLLNTITKANVYAQDQLFATLDTTTREVWLGENKSILLTDTVGFVSNLPHEFIEAFASTLDECVYADLLLNVVDISNANHDMQKRVTLQTLQKIGAKAKVITVYNKIDKLDNFDVCKNDVNSNEKFETKLEKIDTEKPEKSDTGLDKKLEKLDIELKENVAKIVAQNSCENISIIDQMKPKISAPCVCCDDEKIYISASKNINIDKLKEIIIRELF